MPRAIMISNSGGLKVNPQLASLVSSYQTITSLLEQAPSYWWKSSPSRNLKKRRYSSTSTCTTTASTLPQDDEDMIDLQNDDNMINLQQDEDGMIDLQATKNYNNDDINKKQKKNMEEEQEDEEFLTAEKDEEKLIRYDNSDNKKKEVCETPSPWKKALLSSFTNNTITSIVYGTGTKDATKTPSPWKRAANSLSFPSNNSNQTSTAVIPESIQTAGAETTPTISTKNSIADWPSDEKTMLDSEKETSTNMEQEDDDKATQAYDIIEDDDDDAEDTEEEAILVKQSSLPMTQDSFPANITTPSMVQNVTCSASMLDPNVSPIAFQTSPKSNLKNEKQIDVSCKKNESVIVRVKIPKSIVNQKAATKDISITEPKKPMLLSINVEKKDMSIWKYYTQQNFIDELNEESMSSSSFVITSQSVFETCDGFIVTRTYFYLLAIALGMNIVDFKLVRDHYKRNKKLPITLDDDETRLKRNRSTYHVIGDVDATNWNGPLRSRQSSKDKKNNGLLNGYTVYLHGDFDVTGSRRRTAAGKLKSRNSKTDTSSQFTVDRITTLLRLCGATILTDLTPIIDQISSNSAVDNASHTIDISKTVILIRPNPQARDFRRTEKFVSNQGECLKSVLVLKGDWLLDSLAEFMVKPLNDYTK